MIYVLITRPQPEGHKLEELLGRDPKVPAFCEPMLHIVPQKKRLILETGGPDTVTDFMVTSCRVFEIIENWQDYLDIPLWCVGDVTAREAKLRGFKTVHCANRSAQDLLEMIVKGTGQKKDQYYFRHVCGDTLHLDLSEALSRLGYRADKDVVYTTQPSKDLSKKFLGLWTKESFGVAPFFSLRTTEIFVNLIRKHKLQKYCSSIHALAHSEAVLKKLQELQWARIDLMPDLGEEKIRTAYEQVVQNKVPAVNAKMPYTEALNKNAPSIFAWSVTGILTVIVIILIMGWFFLLPRQLDSLRLSLDDQQKILNQNMINQIKSQWDQEFQKQKATFQKEISQLEAKISRLETTVSERNPQFGDNHELYQGQGRLENIEALLSYQKQTTCLDHLKKSVLTQEEQAFLKAQGLNEAKAEDVLSIPQLTTELEALDFSVYTEDTSISEKMLSLLNEVFGIQIRQKKQLSIKETILSDLSQFQFTFLKTLNTKEIQLPASLEKDLTPWAEKAAHTQAVMDKIMGQQQHFQKELTAKAEEIPSAAKTPALESETRDTLQGNN